MRLARHETLSLPAGKAALLIVDVQEEQRSDPDYAASNIAQVLANGAALLVAARAHDHPVAHAAYVRDFSVTPPRPFEPVSQTGAPTFSDPGLGATAICAELAPQGAEPTFVKQDASAFDGTALDPWLRAQGIEWLIVAGVWTEACIAATCRGAVTHGYRVLLVKDACGSGSDFMHRCAVLNLANRLYGGGICDTARATALLSGQSAPVWRVADPVPFRFDASTLDSFYESL